MNIWPQSQCKSHSKSSLTYIIHWRCPLKNALNAGGKDDVGYVQHMFTQYDDQICGKFARAFIIRENVMACTNITMKLYIAAVWQPCAHTHREIVLMPKYGDSIKLEIKFYNSGDSFPYLHFWTHFSFFLPALICLGGSPRGSCFSWLILLLYRIRNGDLHTDFQSLPVLWAHLLNVVANTVSTVLHVLCTTYIHFLNKASNDCHNESRRLRTCSL